MRRVTRVVRSLSEGEVRHALAADGFSEQEIEKKFIQARTFREWAPTHVMERMTAIGHRTERGQVVLAKTDEQGSHPFDRVYVLQCERCGHEHRSDGSRIHDARCPFCS
jgi:hypothetical protein